MGLTASEVELVKHEDAFNHMWHTYDWWIVDEQTMEPLLPF